MFRWHEKNVIFYKIIYIFIWTLIIYVDKIYAGTSCTCLRITSSVANHAWAVNPYEREILPRTRRVFRFLYGQKMNMPDVRSKRKGLRIFDLNSTFNKKIFHFRLHFLSIVNMSSYVKSSFNIQNAYIMSIEIRFAAMRLEIIQF